MTPRSLIFPLLAGFAFFVLAPEAHACSCSRPKSCEYAAQAGAVFIGEVIESVENTKKIDLGGGSMYDMTFQTSTVSVKEVFAGVSETKEVKVLTEISSSCAFGLGKGVTYIFYAYGPDQGGNLVTGFCSGTKPAASAAEEIEELRRSQGQGTTVSGFVTIEGYSGLAGTPPNKHGIKTVRLVSDNGIAEAGIDEQGRYKFTGIPAGEYTFEIPMPGFLRTKNHLNLRSPPGKEEPVRVRVSGIGCIEESFSLIENGKLSGIATDAEGKPIAGLTIFLIPVGADKKPLARAGECYDYGLCQASEEDGRFHFDGLEAGDYKMAVRIGSYICNDCIDAKYRKEYYPTGETDAAAKVITISLSRPTDNINFRLSKTYVERDINGTVTFLDGRPAARVSVRFVARTPDRLNNFITFIKTDETGRFTIKGYEGHEYMIGAFTDERDGNPEHQAAAVELSVLPRKAVKPVKLTLNPSGNSACENCGDFSEFPKRGTKKPN